MAIECKTYALYKNEDLLEIGTIYEIARQLNMNPAAVRYYSTPTYAKRAKSDDVRRLIPIDSSEDEEHTDCFAYTGKAGEPCSALTVSRCNWSRCSFYKPKER